MASRVTRGASETVHSLPVLITEDNLEAIALLTTVQLGDYVRFAFLVSDDVIEPAATTVEKGSFTLGAGFLPRPDLGATQSVDMSAALAIVDHISASSAALRIVRGLSPMRAATPTEGPVPLAAHAVMETPGAIRPTPGRRLSSVARRLTAARTQSSELAAGAPAGNAITEAQAAAAVAAGATEPLVASLVSDSLSIALSSVDLDGYDVLLRKARITSASGLKRYTLSELVDALRTVPGGKGMVFSAPHKRAFAELGVTNDVSPPAANGGALTGAVAGGGTQATETQMHFEATTEDEEILREAALLNEARSQLMAPEPPVLVVGNMDDGVASPRSDEAARAARKAALIETPHVLALLGVSFEVDLTTLSALGNLLQALSPSFFLPNDFDSDMETAADLIDAGLLTLSKSDDRFTIVKLAKDVPKATWRQVRRWLAGCVEHRKAAPSDLSHGESNRGGGGDSITERAIGLMMDANGNKMTVAEMKVIEEVTASNARTDRVLESDEAMEALLALREVLSSDAEPNDKVRKVASTINANATVAELLHSAHVKEPTGTRALEGGRGLASLVRVCREVRTGFVAAAREAAKRCLPAGVDSHLFVSSIFEGEISAKEGRKWSLAEVSEPKMQKSWMGIDEKKADKTPSSVEIRSMIMMFTVIPPLTHFLTVLNPTDSSVTGTMAEVMSLVAMGMLRHGCVTAVDSILGPLLLRYDELWEKFQKSSTASLPTLAAAWAYARKLPSVEGYLAQAAAPIIKEVGSGSSGFVTFDQVREIVKKSAHKPNGKKTDRERQLEVELARLQRDNGGGGGGASRAGSVISEAEKDEHSKYTFDLGEKPDGAGKNWERQRRKRLLARYKKDPDNTSEVVPK